MTTTKATTARCTRCGRELRDLRSVARGVGPTCAKRIKARAEAVIIEHSASAVDKAIELIGDSGIVRVGRATFLSVSSDGATRYETTTASCACKAGQFGRMCYHRVAAQLIAA